MKRDSLQWLLGMSEFIKQDLESQSILPKLEHFVKSGTSLAGKRREEVFTREFLCPSLCRYFYSHVREELTLSDDEIERGLGTEGYQNCPGFGFTPSRGRQHIFRKQDVINPNPPSEWVRSSSKPLPAYQPCPDFAIGMPLPVSVVGDVKYYSGDSPTQAITMLYNSARDAVFYLGAFHGDYDSALIVVADGSGTGAFTRGMQTLRSELLERFGINTHVHLLILKLR
jgi:hypothetical protein